MDKDKIKETLSGYLPEIYNEDDPQIAEALKQAQADPELRQHLEDECQFDRDFSEALRAIPVNYEGMQELLDSDHQEKSSQLKKTDKVIPFKSKRRIRLILASVAVMLLSGFLINYFFFPKPVTFPQLTEANTSDFRDHMAYFATQRFTLEKTTPDWNEARNWLVEKKAPVFNAAPEHLAKLKGMGCREIDWNGTKVSLICFLNGKEELVHLFIVDQANLNLKDLAQLQTLKKYHALETKGWSDQEHVYLLVASEEDISLDGIL